MGAERFEAWVVRLLAKMCDLLSTRAAWGIVGCRYPATVSTFDDIGGSCVCSLLRRDRLLVLLSICLGAATRYHIAHISMFGSVRRRGYFGQPPCVALVSFNLQGIPRRPVMNPFRPGPDEMALDSLFQTPSTFASSNPLRSTRRFQT